ncbi:MAG: V-type ATP synthase subunit I [Haloarculaceae archaeon]
MSKVSVTGSKAVMGDVVEAVHDLYLVHLSDYDGHWEGFDNGSPMAGGDEASEKLVTVRSLKSILGVTDADAGPSRIVTDEALDEELEGIRVEANELDDRRAELRSDLRDIEEREEALEPFARLGIDLDLLYGYDSLSVAVGEGDADSVRQALAGVDGAVEVFAEGDVVAAFAHADESELSEALVEAEFSELEVPREEGDPEDALASLEHREEQVEANLETVEQEVEDMRYDAAGFLLAAEEKLSIEAQKAEAPLSFATTRNAFVAEGWIPTERVDEFEAAVDDAVGDHADVEELEQAAYNSQGHAETHEEVDHAESGAAAGSGGAADAADDKSDETSEEEPEPIEATADGGAEEVRSDGGVVTMGEDDPPVIQDNPGLAEPFELLTEAVGRPNYSEFDPTIVLLLTFPLMFGFIIGDVGYGLIYSGIGYYMYANFDSQAFQRFGLITLAAGAMTTIFGVLYGEVFGLHLIASQFWEGVVGLEHAPIEKGLSPATSYWASTWFIVTTLFGVVHMNVAYVLEFVENRALHGTREAVLESGSWLLALNGLWLFVFSRLFAGAKPPLLFETFSGANPTLDVGFTGFPAVFGWVGLGMVGLGMVFLALGPAYELIEIHQVLAHALSYLRIAAVLLAKAGMAFAVNLLFWGAYAEPTGHGAEWHFGLTGTPPDPATTAGTVTYHGHEVSELLFPGMVHMGPLMVVFGVVVLVVGHLIVLALGVTSSGIQSIRLEYFEFFSKFYEGNGRTYNPFGSERTYTDEQS